MEVEQQFGNQYPSASGHGSYYEGGGSDQPFAARRVSRSRADSISSARNHNLSRHSGSRVHQYQTVGAPVLHQQSRNQGNEPSRAASYTQHTFGKGDRMQDNRSEGASSSLSDLIRQGRQIDRMRVQQA